MTKRAALGHTARHDANTSINTSQQHNTKPHAATATAAAWTYTDGSEPPPSNTPFFWMTALFLISHLFLLPLFLLTLLLLLVTSLEGRAVLLLLFGSYVMLTFTDGAQFTGRRRWFGYISPWVRCHHYFPVVTRMWNGKTFTTTPDEGHARVFDVSTKTFIFALSPHGAIPIGAAIFGPQMARWPAISEKLRFGVASVCFYIPVVRDFYLWFGGVDAGRSTMLSLLRRGGSVALLPGGIKEQLLVCPPNQERIVLMNRKGIAGLACETGAAIVPVFVFGERRAYRVNEGIFHHVSRWLKQKLGIGLPFPRGRWFTLMPFVTPIAIVCGAPLEVPDSARMLRPAPGADSETTAAWQAAVDSLHQRYVRALRELYETHRAQEGYGDVELSIE